MFRTRNYQVPLTHYHGAKQIHHHQIFRGIKSWNKGPNLYRAYMPIWDGPIFGVTIILQRIMTFIICQSVQSCYSIRAINHLTVPNKTVKRYCGCTYICRRHLSVNWRDFEQYYTVIRVNIWYIIIRMKLNIFKLQIQMDF